MGEKGKDKINRGKRRKKMGLFGTLLSLPLRIVNAPIRAVENLIGADDRNDDRILSKPLDTLADEIKKVDD